MKILWITNIPLPPISRAMGWKELPVGGWMYSSLKSLTEKSDSNIAVATVYNGNEFIAKDIDNIRYYLLPLCGKAKTEYNERIERYWKGISDEFQPEVVHIHGSEFPHGLAYVNAVGSSGVVVSIQGMVSGIARYYAGGIDIRSIKKCLTARDIIKHNGLRYGQSEFEKRGKLECELFTKVSHIIGRTEWDKAHAWAINPNAEYHYCGETLRGSFYNHSWEYDKCIPHTIFVSQAGYAIKGLHKLLEAMPIVLRNYPDAKVFVAGSDPTIAPWWRITGYGKYLKTLVRKLGISNNIEFLGMLQEDAMCKAYLKSNVFVCPSSIENSPNSLGEAQLLGMPHIASFVGGIPEIVCYNQDILYRFEETEMLAKKICHVFSLEKNYESPYFESSRYDREKNTSDLISIYSNIKNSDNR